MKKKNHFFNFRIFIYLFSILTFAFEFSNVFGDDALLFMHVTLTKDANGKEFPSRTCTITETKKMITEQNEEGHKIIKTQLHALDSSIKSLITKSEATALSENSTSDTEVLSTLTVAFSGTDGTNSKKIILKQKSKIRNSPESALLLRFIYSECQ